MEENYPVDGKNAERVANLLKAELAKTSRSAIWRLAGSN